MIFGAKINSSKYAILSQLLEDYKRNPAIPSYGIFLSISAIFLLKENKTPDILNGLKNALNKLKTLSYILKPVRRLSISTPVSKKDRKRSNLIDLVFFKKMLMFLKIVLKNSNSTETAYLVIFTLFLIGRTYLSIKVSVINGTLVESIIKADFHLFLKRLLNLALFSIPASSLNSMLRFISAKIFISFRSRLAEHFNELYFSKVNFYSVTNVDGRLKNPDQILTKVINDWCKSFTSLYSDITKPSFDILIFSYKLSTYLGFQGPIYILLWYSFCGALIRIISPAFGKLTARSHALEGQYRALQRNVITSSEEIAFYNGHRRERLAERESFKAIEQHYSVVFEKQFFMGVADQFLTKYGSTLVGYSILGLPVISKAARAVSGPLLSNAVGEENKSEMVAALANDYIRNSSLLISLSGAIGRIVSSYKDLQCLSGHTFVLVELETVLRELCNKKYTRKLLNQPKLLNLGWGPNKGVFEKSTDISFQKIPVIAPNGDILIKTPLTFKIQKGDHVMLSGPNGCGKTAALRILGRIWPLFGGKLSCPENGVMFVPQIPYLTVGNLRDQAIYPMTTSDFLKNGRSDSELESIFDTVKLRHIIERHGWFSEKEWFDVLSGGEKQRVGMARLFFHRPKFAILDECTSAVSVDILESLYAECKSLGITIVTVSHRKSLAKFHDKELRIFDNGDWEFVEINK